MSALEPVGTGANEEEDRNFCGPPVAHEGEGEGGVNQLDTIEIEMKDEQSGKTVEGSTLGAATTNQCCVVM